MTLDETKALVATALLASAGSTQSSGRQTRGLLGSPPKHAMASCGSDREKMDATIVARVNT